MPFDPVFSERVKAELMRSRSAAPMPFDPAFSERVKGELRRARSAERANYIQEHPGPPDPLATLLEVVPGAGEAIEERSILSGQKRGFWSGVPSMGRNLIELTAAGFAGASTGPAAPILEPAAMLATAGAIATRRRMLINAARERAPEVTAKHFGQVLKNPMQLAGVGTEIAATALLLPFSPAADTLRQFGWNFAKGVGSDLGISMIDAAEQKMTEGTSVSELSKQMGFAGITSVVANAVLEAAGLHMNRRAATRAVTGPDVTARAEVGAGAGTGAGAETAIRAALEEPDALQRSFEAKIGGVRPQEAPGAQPSVRPGTADINAPGGVMPVTETGPALTKRNAAVSAEIAAIERGTPALRKKADRLLNIYHAEVEKSVAESREGGNTRRIVRSAEVKGLAEKELARLRQAAAEGDPGVTLEGGELTPPPRAELAPEAKARVRSLAESEFEEKFKSRPEAIPPEYQIAAEGPLTPEQQKLALSHGFTEADIAAARGTQPLEPTEAGYMPPRTSEDIERQLGRRLTPEESQRLVDIEAERLGQRRLETRMRQETAAAGEGPTARIPIVPIPERLGLPAPPQKALPTTPKNIVAARKAAQAAQGKGPSGKSIVTPGGLVGPTVARTRRAELGKLTKPKLAQQLGLKLSEHRNYDKTDLIEMNMRREGYSGETIITLRTGEQQNASTEGIPPVGEIGKAGLRPGEPARTQAGVQPQTAAEAPGGAPVVRGGPEAQGPVAEPVARKLPGTRRGIPAQPITKPKTLNGLFALLTNRGRRKIELDEETANEFSEGFLSLIAGKETGFRNGKFQGRASQYFQLSPKSNVPNLFGETPKKGPGLRDVADSLTEYGIVVPDDADTAQIAQILDDFIGGWHNRRHLSYGSADEDIDFDAMQKRDAESLLINTARQGDSLNYEEFQDAASFATGILPNENLVNLEDIPTGSKIKIQGHTFVVDVDPETESVILRDKPDVRVSLNQQLALDKPPQIPNVSKEAERSIFEGRQVEATEDRVALAGQPHLFRPSVGDILTPTEQVAKKTKARSAKEIAREPELIAGAPRKPTAAEAQGPVTRVEEPNVQTGAELKAQQERAARDDIARNPNLNQDTTPGGPMVQLYSGIPGKVVSAAAHAAFEAAAKMGGRAYFTPLFDLVEAHGGPIGQAAAQRFRQAVDWMFTNAMPEFEHGIAKIERSMASRTGFENADRKSASEMRTAGPGGNLISHAASYADTGIAPVGMTAGAKRAVDALMYFQRRMGEKSKKNGAVAFIAYTRALRHYTSATIKMIQDAGAKYQRWIEMLKAQPENDPEMVQGAVDEFRSWIMGDSSADSIIKQAAFEFQRKIPNMGDFWLDAHDGQLLNVYDMDLARYGTKTLKAWASRTAFIKFFGQQTRQGFPVGAQGDFLKHLYESVKAEGGDLNALGDAVASFHGQLKDPIPKDLRWISDPDRYPALTASVIKAMMLSTNALAQLHQTVAVGPQAFGWVGLAKAWVGSIKNRADSIEAARMMGTLGESVLDLNVSRGRVIHDLSSAISESSNRIFLSKYLDEWNAVVFTRAASNKLKGWEKKPGGSAYDRSDLKILHFTPAEIDALVSGLAPEDLQKSYVRRVVTTSQGIRMHPGERSRFGNSPTFKQLAWFNHYSQIAGRKTWRVGSQVVEDVRSGDPARVKAGIHMAANYFLGTSAAAAGTAFLAAVIGGRDPREVLERDIPKINAKFDIHNPVSTAEWLAMMFVEGTVAAPLRMLQYANPSEGIDAPLKTLSAPYRAIRNMMDGVLGFNQFHDMSASERALKFIKLQTPLLSKTERLYHVALGNRSKEMDFAMNRFFAWKRKKEGFLGAKRMIGGGSLIFFGEIKPFQNQLNKISQALENGDISKAREITDRVMFAGRDVQSMREFFGEKKTVGPLKDEEKIELRNFIGGDSYSELMRRDDMLDSMSAAL